MRGTPVLFQDFSGGVNAEASAYSLKDNECRDARNVTSTARGAIRKRNGSSSFSTPATALTSLYASKNPNFLIGSDGANVYSISTAGASTLIDSGLTASSRWEFISATANGGQGPVYGMNGTEARQWTGVGSGAAWTATAGAVPLGKYVIYHGNRAWVAGVAADPSALFFSNLAAPRDWPMANIVRFDPDDGEAITAIGTIGPYVLVFKPSKAWVVYDLDTGANRRLGENVGCIAHRSVVETPDGTYFLSKDQGVMRTGGQTAERISDKIEPVIAGLADASRHLAAGAYFGRHYYLSVCTSGVTNDLLLDYDVQLRSWWIHTPGFMDLAAWQPSTGRADLYGASSGIARVARLFVPGVTTDIDAAFAAYWSGPFLSFGKPSVRKRCREIHFDGQGRIQVSLAKDFARAPYMVGDRSFTTDTSTFGGDGVFGGDGIFGGTSSIEEARVYTPGVARAWSITFGNSTTDSFEVESYSMMMQERTE